LKESNLASMLLAKTLHGKIQITFEFMEMMIVDKSKTSIFVSYILVRTSYFWWDDSDAGMYKTKCWFRFKMC